MYILCSPHTAIGYTRESTQQCLKVRQSGPLLVFDSNNSCNTTTTNTTITNRNNNSSNNSNNDALEVEITMRMKLIRLLLALFTSRLRICFRLH